ncbi:hypothetical protein MED01_002476 [Micromonospora sp. MED01]|uniref:hypothetical protein n=1 Tax=Micromonospora alfalfae TaxID=2911212 RepID=UPI001EE87F5A|nr:hypothetical protein [Micromonospora alfalfae]MCG5464310.1 hypothetical protein [Micromonospora alfalfae]
MVKPPARLLRCLAQTLAAFALGVAATTAAVTPAQASAWGCSYYGNLGPIKGLPIYNGSYCAGVDGSGTWVDGVYGNFSSAGNVCNWNITAEFFDGAGRWYQTYTSGTHWTCERVGSDSIYIGERKQRGRVCSTLNTNGGRITSVCHNIK